MNSPTPYDGSSKPFTIGLKPLDLADWIEIDHTYEFQMAEKRRLYASIPDKVFVSEPGTETAQQEVLDLLRSHIGMRFPDRFALDSGRIAIDGSSALSSPGIEVLPPLRIASLLVQEDLILLRRSGDGWRLCAGSLCFPSSWTLSEKFGRPLHEIHAPVPGFGAGSRNDELIGRMFDRLQQPVCRFNWSIQAGDALYHPLSHTGRVERAEHRPSKFDDAGLAAAFIRVERQTLRKLPESGDILFTIRIYLDPLDWLARHPQRSIIAANFAEQLRALDREQLDYKGLAADRDRLAAAIDAMAP